jgi:hypothetical protein
MDDIILLSRKRKKIIAVVSLIILLIYFLFCVCLPIVIYYIENGINVHIRVFDLVILFYLLFSTMIVFIMQLACLLLSIAKSKFLNLVFYVIYWFVAGGLFIFSLCYFISISY